MKRLHLLVLIALMLFSTACNRVDTAGMVGAGATLLAGATVSDKELKEASLKMRAKGDAEAKVASGNNPYAKRLEKLTRNHVAEDGLALNYKVYLTPDVNANASADGSIRVYSGLMDMMDDDELLYVLGHEIGHVKDGDSLSAVRVAYTAAATRQGVTALTGTAGTVIDQIGGGFFEQAINAQFSQSQEYDADAYALAFMQKHGYKQQGAVTALRKLEKLGSGGGSILASHPEPGERAKRIEKKIGGQ